MSEYTGAYDSSYNEDAKKKKKPISMAVKIGGAIAIVMIILAGVLGALAATGVFGKSANNGTEGRESGIMRADCTDCKYCELLLHNDPALKTGKYTIDVKGEKVEAYCDMDTDGGGWTVFQKRFDGSTSFKQNWKKYQNGFGNLEAEFWLGLDILNKLTSSAKCVLRVDIGSFKGEFKNAEWTTFKVADSKQNYKLEVGDYSGHLGDSLTYHNNAMFSTADNDNDENRRLNCAEDHDGGNWYKSCLLQNVNGKYINYATNHDQPPHWFFWHGFYARYESMKSSQMMIRNC